MSSAASQKSRQNLLLVKLSPRLLEVMGSRTSVASQKRESKVGLFMEILKSGLSRVFYVGDWLG